MSARARPRYNRAIGRVASLLFGRVERLSLRANFSWALIGNSTYAVCQWGILASLARLGTPEAVGQFALGLAVGAPIMMFANLQLRELQAGDTDHTYSFGDYLALRLISTTLGFLVIAGMSLAGGYRRDTAFVILALGAQKAMQSLSDVYYGLLQQNERMDLVARSLLIKGPSGLTAFAGAYLVTRSVVWAALGLSCVYGLVLYIHDQKTARPWVGAAHLTPSCQAKRLARLAWLALPMGLMAMLVSLNSNIPRLVVERTVGEHGLGLYAAMVYLLVPGSLVINALGQASISRVAHLHTSGTTTALGRMIARMTGIAAGLGLALLVGALVFGHEVLKLLYGLEYARHAMVLSWLTVSAALSYVSASLEYVLTGIRRFWSRLWVALVLVCATLAGCVTLVPRWGLTGAAWATGISSFVNCCLCSAILLRALRVHSESREDPVGYAKT